ncbi:MAG: anti-sigma factor antagonist [Candidatus Dadabacteria bacterium]|nr:MAG: anti-sigma factor antagonist [Candidatus Dadabacteria bacterium]
MEFPTTIEGDKAFIKVTEDLDSEQAGEALRQAFDQVFNQGKRTVILDLKDVQIINSYGIGKILVCYKRLSVENGVLYVQLANEGFVKECFDMLMLQKLLPEYKGA